ncbi:hypothetical protein C4K14_4093 [Pseudomonas chlororaphis subsp. aureofaciens]|uniref:hypothetical protein n=1 Tax=Pseudomonas chlororaphis TaxID=587753 RepID=UPI000F58528A|nr:hypothetical protein [Pseudomonas chlororaphis]AZD86915.1 hypothetical protein C4K14_4093 [Pseudomonas chlororaphis subsp. aureofaciens]
MTTEQVIAFAEGHRTLDDYVYLLVDGLAECAPEYPLSVPSLIQTLGEAAVARVLRPDLAHTPEACPALVQLAAPGEAVSKGYLDLSARYAIDDLAYNKRYVCGWLLSPQPLGVIARHIAAQCHTAAPIRGEAMSPWFEPIRLELLAASMGGQIGGMLMPIGAWLFPTSWGSYALLRSTATPKEAALPQLARETQQAAPLITDFLGSWRHALEYPLGFSPWRWKGTTVLPPQAGTHAFRLVRDARRLGLSNSRDIVALSLHRVFIHPHLPQHPDIQRDIAAAAAGIAGLQERFTTYDDTTWMRIAASLPRAESYT